MASLIKEVIDTINYLVEAKEDGGKDYYVEGIIMQSNVKNRNGRVYPPEILFNEVNRYVKEYVNKNKAYGELNHPESFSINLKEVSHRFTELKQDGDNVIGKAKISDTPNGKIVKALINDGANLGISSRGMGTLKKNSNGIMEVQKDFMLSTAGDIVADPSGPSCYINGIMEGIEYWYDIASGSWKAQELMEDHAIYAKNNYNKIDEEKALKLFREMVNMIKI